MIYEMRLLLLCSLGKPRILDLPKNLFQILEGEVLLDRNIRQKDSFLRPHQKGFRNQDRHCHRCLGSPKRVLQRTEKRERPILLSIGFCRKQHVHVAVLEERIMEERQIATLLLE